MHRLAEGPYDLSMAGSDLVVVTEKGLFCPRGGFHVDPWAPVERAVITHAHADHATPGCASYLASPATTDLMRARMGAMCPVEPLALGEVVVAGEVRLSLHPAGHVLGSSQVLLEAPGTPSWCISGDYKVIPDATCEAFEPVRCDVFISESTFGLPIFRWRDEADIIRALNAWRSENAAQGRTSVLLCYALGKAQRVLAALDPGVGPIGVHGAVMKIAEVYAARGIRLPPHVHASAETAVQLKGVGTVIAPPSAAATPWLRRFAGPSGVRTAMVSGWMSIRGRRRWRAMDTGFVLSDHADWPGLLGAIRATGATRVGVTHGYAPQLARYLAEEAGLDTMVIPTRYGDEDEAGAPDPAEAAT